MYQEHRNPWRKVLIDLCNRNLTQKYREYPIGVLHLSSKSRNALSKLKILNINELINREELKIDLEKLPGYGKVY